MRSIPSAARVLVSLVLALAAFVLAPAARAEVHRCNTPDGTAVFTDRRCSDIGAVERAPDRASPAARLYRPACSRTLQDLVLELSTAIDTRDVNRAAGLYHWVGLSGSAAYAVMNRLQVIVDRPLVDVTPVYPSAGDDAADADYYPQTTTHRTPIGLRLEQTLANGSTPSHTVLGLRRYLGCWWITQ
jgi:hypothetical protein